MGDIISLDERRRRREQHAGGTAGTRPQVVFAFDLTSPWTYLAAERVERALPGAAWTPVLPGGAPSAGWTDRGRDDVAERADLLHMPLVWPEHPGAGVAATRIAAWAAEQGKAPAFVLAATRLAFCGGFDLDDPEILVEASAAAHLGLDESLRAAGDGARDARLSGAAARLREQGADRLPVIRVGRLLFCGEERISAAAAARRDPRCERRRLPSDGFAG